MPRAAARTGGNRLLWGYNCSFEPGRFLCHGLLRGPGGTAYSLEQFSFRRQYQYQYKMTGKRVPWRRLGDDSHAPAPERVSQKSRGRY